LCLLGVPIPVIVLALTGLAELGFPVFFEIVHVEVAVGLEPVLMSLGGDDADYSTK
jgi:hypothetical protein